MKDLYRITDSVSQTHAEYHRMSIPKGKAVVLADLKGPGKVTYWYITDDANGFYAGLVLKVHWDGRADPSINVPLSDFFGGMKGHPMDYQITEHRLAHLLTCNSPKICRRHYAALAPESLTGTVVPIRRATAARGPFVFKNSPEIV